MKPMPHTAGPWHAHMTGTRWFVSSQKSNVAALPWLDAQSVADAKLIAASPDLLDALRTLHAICSALNDAPDNRPSESEWQAAMAKSAYVLGCVNEVTA